ncbi:MAG: lipopolysaccharide kinase InaA family protein, partial [Gammaproteobacteria bacterium]
MNHFSSKWVVAKDYRGTAAGERFATLEKVFSCTGEEITDDPISQVLRVSVGDRRYYVKRYTAARKSISRFFGKSRICSEWENLLAFEKLGIPVPPIVAYGQKTRRGLFKCGALVTEEVPGAADLDRYVRKHRAILQDKAWVRAVIDQVADYTRVMHRAGFVHGNLNWRNILVTTSGEPRVFFIDCP